MARKISVLLSDAQYEYLKKLESDGIDLSSAVRLCLDLVRFCEVDLLKLLKKVKNSKEVFKKRVSVRLSDNQLVYLSQLKRDGVDVSTTIRLSINLLRLLKTDLKQLFLEMGQKFKYP